MNIVYEDDEDILDIDVLDYQEEDHYFLSIQVAFTPSQAQSKLNFSNLSNCIK